MKRFLNVLLTVLLVAGTACGAVLTSEQIQQLQRTGWEWFNGAGGANIANRVSLLDTNGQYTGALTAVTNLSASGNITSAQTIQGLALTDGYGTLRTGAMTLASLTASGNITSSQTIQGLSLTDGYGTLRTGALTLASLTATGNIRTSASTIQGVYFTDGTATLTAGAWTKLVSIALTGNATSSAGTLQATGFTDGTGSLRSGAYTGASVNVTGNITSSQTIQGLSLTDGYGTLRTGALTLATLTATGNIRSSAGTIQGVGLTDGSATLYAGGVTGMLNISAATVTYRSILDADISASAAIARTKLAEEALAIYGLPLLTARNADGTIVNITTTDGNFVVVPTAAGAAELRGYVYAGGTQLHQAVWEAVVPQNYDPAGSIVLQMVCRLQTTNVNPTATLSMRTYRSDGQNGAGSNLSTLYWNGTTSATTYTNLVSLAGWQTITSNVDPATLGTGDNLRIYLQIYNATGTYTCFPTIEVGRVRLLLDSRG